MKVYRGLHAAHYDRIYAEKDYRREAELIGRYVERYGAGAGRRLLDLACGTGSHAFAFEAMGFDVVGVDRSAVMIEEARRRAERNGSRADFVVADFRRLELAVQPFDAVACLFDSIGYAETNEGVLAVLAGAKRHLVPGGVFIAEFLHGAAMLRSFEPVRQRRYATPDGPHVRRSETMLDVAGQVARIEITLEAEGGARAGNAEREEHRLRFFLVEEMALFLTVAGLERITFEPAYEDGGAIGADTWHVLAVARRAAAT